MAFGSLIFISFLLLFIFLFYLFLKISAMEAFPIRSMIAFFRYSTNRDFRIIFFIHLLILYFLLSDPYFDTINKFSIVMQYTLRTIKHKFLIIKWNKYISFIDVGFFRNLFVKLLKCFVSRNFQSALSFRMFNTN